MTRPRSESNLIRKKLSTAYRPAATPWNVQPPGPLPSSNPTLAFSANNYDKKCKVFTYMY